MQCASVQPLRFGAWLGRKYTPDAIKTKVYVETPRTWRPHPMACKGRSPPRRRAAGLTLLMVGYYPESADSPREYYYQWHSARITRDDILAVMRLFEGESRFSALMPLLRAAAAGQAGLPRPPTDSVWDTRRTAIWRVLRCLPWRQVFRRQPPRFRRYHRAAGARWPSHAAA